eukprot:scaffold202210_cov32-Tisochrysis_lutea.AAC.3
MTTTSLGLLTRQTTASACARTPDCAFRRTCAALFQNGQGAAHPGGGVKKSSRQEEMNPPQWGESCQVQVGLIPPTWGHGGSCQKSNAKPEVAASLLFVDSQGSGSLAFCSGKSLYGTLLLLNVVNC